MALTNESLAQVMQQSGNDEASLDTHFVIHTPANCKLQNKEFTTATSSKIDLLNYFHFRTAKIGGMTKMRRMVHEPIACLKRK